MRFLFAAIAALAVATFAFAGPHHNGGHKGGHHNGGHSGAHKGAHNGHHHGGPKHHCGKVHRGCTYRHYCYTSQWCGWNKRCWVPRYSVYIFWCPNQCCWYRCVNNVYVPCDNLCSPSINVNDVVID
jgi:hypothetical protein